MFGFVLGLVGDWIGRFGGSRREARWRRRDLRQLLLELRCLTDRRLRPDVAEGERLRELHEAYAQADVFALPCIRAANGDLHAGQVLAGTREPWLVVDPMLLRGQ